MIVKILPPSATFKGVSYNTNKIEKDKGELMKVVNFGALQSLDYLRPSDYINYLKARSKTSSRVKFPQFHAVISCKGKSHSKDELTQIASDWLMGMGYAKQPYMLIFHKDTDNNHIHIVSTRIGEDGKKINDSYEKIRAYQVLNQVIGVDEKVQLAKDLGQALSYHFATRAQFMMLLESKGYTLKLTNDTYQLIKFGKEQGSVDAANVDGRIKMYNKDLARLAQLRAITKKYQRSHDSSVQFTPQPMPGVPVAKTSGYTSKMSELLESKFGIQIIFHGKPGMLPYGYTLIDHAQKRVYKGGDLMPIEEFISPPFNYETEQNRNVNEESITDSASIVPNGVAPTEQQHDLQSSSSQTESEKNLIQTGSLNSVSPNNDKIIDDRGDPEVEILPGLQQSEENSAFQEEAIRTSHWQGTMLDLSDDIDDEAILGRNRRRKGKARTNTR